MPPAKSSTVPAPLQSRHASTSIPYRDTGDGSGFQASALSALGMTVTLLAAVLVLLLLARRAGWLSRLGIVSKNPALPGRLQVRQRIRISPATRMYVIGEGQDEFVLIESSQHILLKDREEQRNLDDAD